MKLMSKLLSNLYIFMQLTSSHNFHFKVCTFQLFLLYLDKWLPHLCHGDSWVAPHYPSCTVSSWIQSLHSWCIEEQVHSLHQSRHHQLKLPLKIRQYNLVLETLLWKSSHKSWSYYLHLNTLPPLNNQQFYTWCFQVELPADNSCLFFPPPAVHVTHSPPEPPYTDLHSALTLLLSTNKTKISRAAVRLGGGVSLTDNTGYRASEMIKLNFHWMK